MVFHKVSLLTKKLISQQMRYSNCLMQLTGLTMFPITLKQLA